VLRQRMALYRVILAAIAVLLGLGPVSPAVAATKVYALVVGADRYQHLAALRGAVNDAELLSKILIKAGIEVHQLIDDQVTRQKVLDGLKALIAEAQPGDWIIFTYAGHGGREPLNGSPSDIVDTFLLPSYDNPRPQNAERIINHEFRAILQTVPRGVTVLFLADSCHSASMVRSIFAKGGVASYSFRGTAYGPVVEDALPPPPKSTDAHGPEALPNVVFIGASLDDQNTPEMTFDGRYHGAVSWYFAKALDGEADVNKDGKTTLSELRTYIEVDAREAASSRQTPQVEFLQTRGNESLPFVHSSAVHSSMEDDEGFGVYVVGQGTAELAALNGLVKLVSAESAADFVWDPSTGIVTNNRAGDLVAERVTSAAALVGVIGKWRAMANLRSVLVRNPLEVRIGPDVRGARYSAGSFVSIQIGPSKDPALKYLTVLDLTSSGVVQTLYPSSEAEAEEQNSLSMPALGTQVVGPFGADHIIALRTATRPDRLRDALRGFACRPSAAQLVALLNQVVQETPASVGIVPLYTVSAATSSRTTAETSTEC